MSDLRIRVLIGGQSRQYLDAVAALRIAVFRHYPYLYDGDLAYEANYLRVYAESARSVFVLAQDGDRIVGASTGIPLQDDGAAFQQPFLQRGMDISRVFYFGESVLLPNYRGRGIGHAFFDAREAHARGLLCYDWTAFAAVERLPDDPRRPAGHRDNDTFWIKRGYQPQADMRMNLAWKELGEPQESEKPLQFWLRRLESH